MTPTSNVLIRPYTESDAPALVAAVQESHVDVGRWMSWCHAGYGLDDAHRFIRMAIEGHANGSQHDFAICDPDGRYLGGCGVNHINAVDRFAKLGYWMRSSSTGRGRAPAAARAVIEWTFANTPLNRLEVVVAVGNARSQRVAEKIPAQREGVLRHRLLIGGRPADAVMFSVLRGEWSSQGAAINESRA
jgi:ribosomal-protein-serine acetyltransferase